MENPPLMQRRFDTSQPFLTLSPIIIIRDTLPGRLFPQQQWTSHAIIRMWAVQKSFWCQNTVGKQNDTRCFTYDTWNDGRLEVFQRVYPKQQNDLASIYHSSYPKAVTLTPAWSTWSAGAKQTLDFRRRTKTNVASANWICFQKPGFYDFCILYCNILKKKRGCRDVKKGHSKFVSNLHTYCCCILPYNTKNNSLALLVLSGVEYWVGILE